MSTETKQALEQAAQATVADLAGTSLTDAPTAAPANLSVQEAAELPDLLDADPLPLDLVTGYWSPESVGESKRCFFRGIEDQQYADTDNADPDTGEVPTKTLRVVNLIERYEAGDGTRAFRTIRNGSARLVAFFAEDDGTPRYAVNDAFKIEFKGKEKNSTNNFKSDRWAIYPLAFGQKALKAGKA